MSGSAWENFHSLSYTYRSTGGVSCLTEQRQNGRSEEEEEGENREERREGMSELRHCVWLSPHQREKGGVTLLGSKNSLWGRCDSLTQPSTDTQRLCHVCIESAELRRLMTAGFCLRERNIVWKSAECKSWENLFDSWPSDIKINWLDTGSQWSLE